MHFNMTYYSIPSFIVDMFCEDSDVCVKSSVIGILNYDPPHPL